MALKCSMCRNITKILRYPTVNSRFSSTKCSNSKGLVLGVYTKSESQSDTICSPPITLTKTSEFFDQKTCGKLSHHLKYIENDIKPGKSYVFWGLDNEYPAIAVTGIGEENPKFDPIELYDPKKEMVRKAAASGCNALKNVGIKEIFVESFGDGESAAEGSTLGTWKFQEYKTKKDDEVKINYYQGKCETNCEWDQGVIKANAQNLARKLSDTPANLLTPKIFSKVVAEMLKSPDITVEIHDEAWAKTQGMNAFLAVAKGSIEPPKFLELTYKKGGSNSPFYVLVGKGVTFDSGGISLKPSASMDQMRADMSGAANVVATLSAISELKIPVNLKVLVPLVENMPSGSAMKPGDLVKAMNGKTICIDNTDAEGRLILADALTYSAKFNPKWVLDIATLTGAMAVAIGYGATGVFTNSDQLYSVLRDSSIKTGDRVWRFPLWKLYLDNMSKHDAYDLNNISSGRDAGSCTAAAFLREFIPENTDWLHLDMAGVMGPLPDSSTPYLCKGMTGRPTRTLIEFIAAQSEKTQV